MINYSIHTSNDRILDFIFWVFSIVAFTLVYVLGSVVLIVTKMNMIFSFSNSFLISLSNYAIYTLWIVLGFFLISTVILINFIRLRKNPFSNKYLPNDNDISDINFLVKEPTDFDEFFLKNTPFLEVFKNPPRKNHTKQTYELVFNIPIKMKNLYFVIKIHQGNKCFLRCYGKLSGDVVIGEKFSKTLTESFQENLYLMMKDDYVWGEVKVYYIDENKFSTLSQILLSTRQDGDSIIFISSRAIDSNSDYDLDCGIFSNIDDEQNDFVTFEELCSSGIEN